MVPTIVLDMPPMPPNPGSGSGRANTVAEMTMMSVEGCIFKISSEKLFKN